MEFFTAGIYSPGLVGSWVAGNYFINLKRDKQRTQSENIQLWLLAFAVGFGSTYLLGNYVLPTDSGYLIRAATTGILVVGLTESIYDNIVNSVHNFRI
jgi:hypothetical protein